MYSPDNQIGHLWSIPEADNGILKVRDDEILMQFTGLQDKNGKDDWIGDIVKVRIGTIYYYRKIFQAKSGAFCINVPALGHSNSEGAPIFLISIEHENIGNIHENPELLNNENK